MQKSFGTIKQKKENKYSYALWLDRWLKSKIPTVKDSTYIRYMNTVEKHIKPELGRYLICEINNTVIEEFITKKKQSGKLNGSGGLSPKTLSDIVVIIKDSFRYAKISGATVNCSFNTITVKRNYKEMRVLSVTEEKRLLSVLMKDFDTYKLGVFLCLYTGIRIGELCALQWKNVSIDEKTIKIERTMQRLQCGNSASDKKTHIIISEPKSFYSSRTIPLPRFIIEKIEPFYGDSDCYILSDNVKTFVEPRTMQNRFKSYLKEGNIKDANFHCLRHTFATRCVEAGFDIKSLSEILGHSSVNITLNKYVHSSMKQKRDNMEKLTPKT